MRAETQAAAINDAVRKTAYYFYLHRCQRFATIIKGEGVEVARQNVGYEIRLNKLVNDL
jgi:hypothetical protein